MIQEAEEEATLRCHIILCTYVCASTVESVSLTYSELRRALVSTDLSLKQPREDMLSNTSGSMNDSSSMGQVCISGGHNRMPQNNDCYCNKIISTHTHTDTQREWFEVYKLCHLDNVLNGQVRLQVLGPTKQADYYNNTQKGTHTSKRGLTYPLNQGCLITSSNCVK